jgi:hypothetical protein
MMNKGTGHVVVVRRGEAAIFRSLQEHFGQGPDPTPVIWDRRVRDRRVIIQDVPVERRRGERRAPADVTTWSRRGFIVVRSERTGGTREDTPTRRRPRNGPTHGVGG